MILFINNSGTVTNSLPETVYQGSANANSIYVVAPFAKNLTATVAYSLPNTIVTTPQSLTYTGEISGFTDDDGNTYYGWECSLPNSVTALYGTVMGQVTFYSSGKTLCSAAFSFVVGRGVASALPDTPTDDIYDQILQNISTLQSDLANGFYASRAIYAWSASYKYGANELVYYPYDEYGVFVKSTRTNNTTPPLDSNGDLNAGWETVVDFNAVMSSIQAALNAKTSAEQAASSAQAAQTAQNAAETAESNASASATSAAQNASQAAQNATNASNSAVLSMSWAVGGTGTRAGEDTNNSEYYAGQAGQSATSASTSASAASASERSAGQNASSASQSAGQAEQSATEAANSASAAATSRQSANASAQGAVQAAGQAGQSASSAANSANAAANSEANAESAAVRAEAAADRAEEIIGSDYATTAEAAGSLNGSLNTTTYVMKLNLVSVSGKTLSTVTFDLPVESMVVGGSYDPVNKQIVLTLQSGETVDIPVGDLVSGLASEASLNAEITARKNADKSLQNNITTVQVDLTSFKTQVANTYMTKDGTYPDATVGNATRAVNATNATNATNAMNATNDGNGNVIADTYARKTGTYSDMKVGHANTANTANTATKATQDGDGKKISATYAKKDGSYGTLGAGNLIATKLTTGNDLNNCVPSVNGVRQIWYCDSVASTTTILNLPEGVNNTFTLECVKTWNNPNTGQFRAYQILYISASSAQSGNIYVRSIDGASAGSTWTEWESVVTDIGSYPQLGAGYLTRYGYVNASAQAWYKIATIDIARLGKQYNSYSCIMLVNGVHAPQQYSYPNKSGCIDIDMRYNEGVMITSQSGISVLSGNLDPNDFCITISGTVTTLYAHMPYQYAQSVFTILQEASENKPITQILNFTISNAGTSAPSGAVYAVIRNNASGDENGLNIADNYALKNGSYSTLGRAHV